MPNPITGPFQRWLQSRRARQLGRADGESAANGGRPDYEPLKGQDGQVVRDDDGNPKLNFPQGELEIRHGFTDSIDRIGGPWADSDQTLLSRFRTAEMQRRARQREVSALESEVARLTDQQKALEKRKAGKKPPVVETKWWYWVVLVFFALFEIPLNAIAFRPFREAEIMNYALALLIGGVLVLLGHCAGSKLKEGRVRTALLMLALPVGALCAVAYVRTSYLAGGASGMTSPGSFWVFWTLGAMVLAATVVLAYMCEEGREDAMAIGKNLRDVRRALQRQQRELKQSTAALESRQKEVEAVRTRRTALFKKAHAKVRSYQNTAKVLITEYRRHYLRAYRQHARSGDARPTEAVDIPAWYLRMGEKGIAVEHGDENRLDWSVPEE